MARVGEPSGGPDETVVDLARQVAELDRKQRAGAPAVQSSRLQSPEAASEIVTNEESTRASSPVVFLLADHRYPDDGGGYRVIIGHVGADGVVIPKSALDHHIKSTDEIVLGNATNNIAMVFGLDTLYISDIAGANPKACAASSFPTWSSRHLKEQITELPYDALTAGLAAPVLRWFYKADVADERTEERPHIGPMAEDLPPELRLPGPDGTELVASEGVAALALAGVQKLFQVMATAHQRIDAAADLARTSIVDLRQRTKALETENGAQAARLLDLETRLAALENPA